MMPTAYSRPTNTTPNTATVISTNTRRPLAYSEGYATLTMVFQDTPAEEEHYDGQIEHSCNASTFEKPLENKENYLANLEP